ncbi:MAG: proton-conducting transporter membrane subunit [Treponema sp.]|nr:proton-conducting transporter membrane subunit [Treponema sp.]
MSSIGFVLVAIIISAASGLPVALSGGASRRGQAISALMLVAAGVVGLVGVLPVFASAATSSLALPWGLPSGAFAVGLDALSGIFLVPIFIIPALGAVYGLGYWHPADRPEDGRRLGLSYGLLVAGMALVAIARDGLLFLVAWELMALASWFAATAEAGKSEVRRAGWVYLVATHVGTLVLFAMFALWKATAGSFALERNLAIQPEAAGAIFVLALIGFGLKAGLVPLHVWLPGAHANAPSHVSAVMSGVMIKLGIYGILRMTSLMPTPDQWWGWTLFALGGVSALAGIAWATGQGDIKRVLAYSSVENMGIIAMGAGLALVGKSLGRPSLILLGMGGALFHVWNHSLFKSLLFLDAGLVIHETGTRRLERMGGLAKRLPLAAALFGLGAAALSALPPLNGFAGEWMLYLGFFRGVTAGPGRGLPVAALGAALLATVGALAVAAFVRLFGAVFLGAARSAPNDDHEAPNVSLATPDNGLAAHGKGKAGGSARLAMLAPMVALGLACIVLGFAPGLVLPAIGDAAGTWANLREGGRNLVGLADFSWSLPLGLALVGVVTLLLLYFSFAARGARKPGRGTWDCGFAAPTSRMQYGASSFGEFLGRNLSFVRVTRRKSRRPRGAFPAPGFYSSKTPDPVLDLSIRPLAAFAGRSIARMRILHQGQTQIYLIYVLLATVILLIAGVAPS